MNTPTMPRPLTTTRTRLLTIITLLVLALGFTPTLPAHAATLDVCASGCAYTTIQAAIDAASAGDTLTIGAGTYRENVTIAKDVTLQGAGATQTIIDGGVAGSVISVNAGTTVSITNVTITNGRAIWGGGIHNYGTLTLTTSTLSSNSATFGGGVFNASGTATLSNSTVSGNSATYGGGIHNYGTLTLTTSTLSSNSAIWGGGIHNYGTLTLTSSTVSGNSATFGGGIRNDGTLTLKSSIVAKHGSGGDCVNYATITSQGYNLDSDGTCSLTQPTDQPSRDPKLGPLADNGGPTQTHALLSGSPAIDAIPVANCTVTTDQRGITRPQGTACDIGAFEVEQAADTTAPIFGACPAAGPFTLKSGTQTVGPITATDEANGSGLNASASTLTASVDTSSVGTQTVTFSAVDNANNGATKTCSYQVIYKWTGFLQPVDNAPTVNVVKAGSAIPVKFSLSGNQGLNIFAAGYPKAQQISCSDGAPSDDIEQTVTAGSSSLQYDATSDTYTYVWKTDKAWAGSCRQLIVRLADGTDHVATFRFK